MSIVELGPPSNVAPVHRNQRRPRQTAAWGRRIVPKKVERAAGLDNVPTSDRLRKQSRSGSESGLSRAPFQSASRCLDLYPECLLGTSCALPSVPLYLLAGSRTSAQLSGRRDRTMNNNNAGLSSSMSAFLVHRSATDARVRYRRAAHKPARRSTGRRRDARRQRRRSSSQSKPALRLPRCSGIVSASTATQLPWRRKPRDAHRCSRNIQWFGMLSFWLIRPYTEPEPL